MRAQIMRFRCGAIVSLGLLALASACATPRTPVPVEANPPPLPADSPEWLRDAMSREGALSDPMLIEGGDFRFTSSALASDEILRKENHYELRFDVGATSPIQCALTDGRLDLAGALVDSKNQLLEHISGQQGKLKPEQLLAIHADSIGPDAFLGADWIYVTEETGSLGMIKQRVARKGTRGIACHHIGVGYLATFDRVFRELLGSLAYPSDETSPRYQEVWIASLEGQEVGVQTVELSTPEDAQVYFDTQTSYLLPTQDGSGVAVDTRDVEVSTEGGLVVGHHAVRSANGSRVTDMGLTYSGDGWQVRGQRGGKAIALDLSYEGVLAAHPAWLRAINAAAIEHGVGAELSTERWSPDRPEEIVKTRVTITGEAEGQLNGWLELAGARSTIGFAADGTLAYIQKRLQSVPVDLERVYARGDL